MPAIKIAALALLIGGAFVAWERTAEFAVATGNSEDAARAALASYDEMPGEETRAKLRGAVERERARELHRLEGLREAAGKRAGD